MWQVAGGLVRLVRESLPRASSSPYLQPHSESVGSAGRDLQFHHFLYLPPFSTVLKIFIFILCYNSYLLQLIFTSSFGEVSLVSKEFSFISHLIELYLSCGIQRGK
ncbi:hypothetical protein O6H91_01G017500 [Diphasiastrum complanatum]|uniref:Uncharacterized protein n=1 Tax=Diphasiastrum complanatum TaxID=34168 RepID=A0ACC2ENQ8_DIPCM|nr:hypothetical protein O6H91_01G017500 [Diphasiastrum complanatum]